MTATVVFAVLLLLCLVALVRLGLPRMLHAFGLHPDYGGALYKLPGRRALLVTTSHDRLDPSRRKTGVFLAELTAPYYAFRDGGMIIDVVSIAGGAVPVDPLSRKWFLASPAELRAKDDPEFQRVLAATAPIADVDFAAYDIVFLVGGWGAAYDFGQSAVLGEKLTAAWAAGAIVGGVCHGPLGLLRARDEAGGPLVAGRRLTAVTDRQLRQMHVTRMPLHPERDLRAAGALFESRSVLRDAFAHHCVVDGRLVTGQNQNSGLETAHRMMAAAGGTIVLTEAEARAAATTPPSPPGAIGREFIYMRAAARGLRRTRRVVKTPEHTVGDMFDDLARRHGERLALFSDTERLTFGALNRRANRYARWARAQGIGKGDVVALLMQNCPDYVCVWAGVARVGGVTALLNTSLPGPALAQCINAVGARAIIVGSGLAQAFAAARPALVAEIAVFMHGETAPDAGGRIDIALEALSDADMPAGERAKLTIDDVCLHIFTSGTTGLPKAARMTHRRVLMAMNGFAALMSASEKDRMYNVLPMHHTIGGLAALGAVLTAGGSCFVRERFSAREFWSDIVEHDCTMFAYIGELCRYLLAAPSQPLESAHRIRLCFGNGLRPDIFERFRDRFGLAKIVEFYGSTEGNIGIFNLDSRPGSVGRIPKWMEWRLAVKIVRCDPQTGAPMRDHVGRCIECAPGEPGEAIGKINDDPSAPGNRYEGYVDAADSQARILRDVFAPGDAWFRSGDLLWRDVFGYFFFVDRIGDTFRWKGENVSTLQVSEAAARFAGVRDAAAYGVAVPHADGRAGMLALAVDAPERFDFDGFAAHMNAQLPTYARPLFIRLRDELDLTATFKQRKAEMAAAGFDPAKTGDPLYFADPRREGFVRLDSALHAELNAGAIRL